MLPLPVLHGCTIGELAQMINAEGWIANKKNPCSLKYCKPDGNMAHLIHFPSNRPLNTERPVYPIVRLALSFEATRVSMGRGPSGQM